MSHKLSIGMAALAIAIAVASCGENEGPTSKQSGSAPEAQQTPSTQAEQPEAEKQAAERQQAPLEAGQQKQAPEVAGQQQPSTTQSPPTESETAPARTEAQPTQPQQSQAQQVAPQPQQSPQVNQPAGSQQATTTPAGPLNLTRDQILEAQSLLRQKGFDAGDIDGIIGPRTRRAVIAFQRQQGLEPNGQIDARTASALGLSTSSTTGGNSTRPQQP